LIKIYQSFLAIIYQIKNQQIFIVQIMKSFMWLIWLKRYIHANKKLT